MHNCFRLTVAACIGISSAVFSTSSLAYDFSQATVATGPAGTIATNVYNPYYAYGFSQIVDARGWGGIINSTILNNTTKAVNGALVATINGQIGTIDTGKTRTDTSTPVPIINIDSIDASGRVYTAPTNPAQTSLSFTFTGIAAAADVITATLTGSNIDNTQSFNQVATWNGQGAFNLTIDAPVGFNVDMFRIGLSATTAATVSSMTVGLKVAAVPEAGTFAMMAIGMLGLFGLRQKRLAK